MRKTEIVIVASYDEQPLSLHEVCDICQLSEDSLFAYIKYDIIHPMNRQENEYYFSPAEINKIKKAQRLQHTFDLNLPALALILELLDERDALAEHNAMLLKHLFWHG